MKSLHRHFLTLGLLAGFGVAAVAQPQTPPAAQPGAPRTMQAEHGHMDPAHMEQHRDHMQQRMAARMDRLKQTLRITPAQEGAWTTWTAAVKPTQMQRPDRGELLRLSTPERIDRMRALRATRAAEADKRGEATKAFYASLSPEQKRVFDVESLHFGRGGREGHGGGMGGHGHQRG